MSSRGDARRVLLLCVLALAALAALPLASARADYAAEVSLDTPLAYYPLNGTSTTSVADATGHGYTLTGTTSGLTAQVAGPFAGAKAVAFSGGHLTRSYFNYTNNFAIELWARSSSIPNQREAMVSNGWVGTDNCWHGVLAVNYSASVYGYDANTCSQGGQTGWASIFAGQTDWHHIVVQRVSGVTSLYVDGTVQPQTDSQVITLNGGSFRIGGWHDNGKTGTIGQASDSFGFFYGAISNVAYYNHTLTAARIAKHFNIASGAPSSTTAPSISPSTDIGAGTTLTAARGAWVGADVAYAYQWRRCDADGTNCADISGATSSTYTLQGDDAGHAVRVRVTATNTEGSTAATSAATDAVAFQAPHGQTLYSAAVLNDTPLAFYPLDDASTAGAADVTGHGYSLTGSGTMTARVAGPFAGSYGMGFGGGYQGRSYFGYTNNFAIELWARSQRVPSEREAMVSNGWVGSDYCWHGVLAVNSGPSVYGYDANTCSQGGQTTWASPFTSQSDWHHIVVQRVAGVTSLFVDGVVQPQTDSQVITLNGGSFRIGGWHDSKKGNSVGLASDSFGAFYGAVSNVAYYNHTLTATQITSHYAAANGVPTATTRPSIAPSGALYDGDSVTASTGTWAGSGTISYAYQWQSCDTACAPIAGATGNTYTLTSAEVGKTLKVAVTATNSAGTGTATSTATTVVGAALPANTAAPTVSGTAADGATLTAARGTWTGSPAIAYTYQWQRDGADIAGATSDTYTSSSADVGHALRVVVTATNARGAVSATSAATAPIAAVVPNATGTPAVSGDTTDFATLTSTLGTWSGTTPIDYARQWRRCDADGTGCADIAGATDANYTLTSADVGHAVRLAVTATNAAGTATATSAATGAVAGVAPASTDAPVVSGTARDGEPLSASAGAWSGTTPIAHAHRWQRCDADGTGCADIPGATDANYTLTSADAGHTLRVVVTASNVAGSASRASAVTGTVAAVAPAGAALPEISGDAVDGTTLTAAHGTWTGTTPITYTYEWRRCDDAGANCHPIAGATEATYTLQGADLGHALRVVVTATNAAGTATATSAATTVVLPLAPSATSAPAITGQAVDGATLTATLGTWAGTTPITYTYEWQRCDGSGANCHPIANATDATYTLTSTDVGHAVRIAVTAANTAGSETRIGVPTGAVAGVAPASTTAPAVSGTPLDGETLVAGDGAWSGTTPLSYSYRWQRCAADGTGCDDVAGAGTGNAYTSTSADVGHALRVVVTATNVAGSASRASTPTAPVAAIPPTRVSHTMGPSITGSLVDGQTLTASPGVWSGSAPITYTYQWRRCGFDLVDCFDIAGATAATYTLTSAEISTRIQVLVTASNAGGSASLTTVTSMAVTGFSPTPTTAPSISGTATDGATLTAAVGTWTGSTPITYNRQWKRCDAAGANCAVIPYATGATYTLTAADIGKTLRVVVTASNRASSWDATSAATAVVTPTAPSSLTTPVLDGYHRVNQDDWVSTGTWSGTAPLSYSYRWQRCDADGTNCADIPGEDASWSSRYTLPADVGHRLRAIVTATNAAGSASVASALSPVIVP